MLVLTVLTEMSTFCADLFENPLVIFGIFNFLKIWNDCMNTTQHRSCMRTHRQINHSHVLATQWASYIGIQIFICNHLLVVLRAHANYFHQCMFLF